MYPVMKRLSNQLVSSIKEVESSLGKGKKKVMPSEFGNQVAIRKSIVARRSIAAGELFSEENLKKNPYLNSDTVLTLWNNSKKRMPGTNHRLVWNIFCFLEWYRQHETKFGLK